MAKISFLDRILAGDLLVADGATGTNLQTRGLESGKPSEDWLFERPEEIRKLHSDFIQAGADIILTNTFGGSALRLEATGRGDLVEAVNQKAVELARDAIGEKEVYLAGSIGPSGGLLKPLGPLDESDVFTSFARQAKALADAQVDLLVVETQFDLNEAGLAVKAVRSVCDLPLICSFSYDRGVRTMMGITPKQMADVFMGEEYADSEITMLGINCGRSLEENLSNLEELKSVTDLPIWFKPNAGLPKLDEKGSVKYDISPWEMGDLVRKWIKGGAQVIGGCCGTTPEHLREISKGS